MPQLSPHALHEAIDKVDGVVFRCIPSGDHADRWLEIPAWMFDRAACPDPSRLVTAPFVSMSALSALFDFLAQALKKPPSSSSKAPLSRTSKFSHDQNRREGYDHTENRRHCRRYRPRAEGFWKTTPLGIAICSASRHRRGCRRGGICRKRHAAC